MPGYMTDKDRKRPHGEGHGKLPKGEHEAEQARFLAAHSDKDDHPHDPKTDKTA